MVRLRRQKQIVWLHIVQKDVYKRQDKVVPLYIEVDDMTRIERSLKREKEQKNPCVSEVCRRFLADEKDFSKENLKRLNITDKIVNDSVENALREIVLRIKSGR